MLSAAATEEAGTAAAPTKPDRAPGAPTGCFLPVLAHHFFSQVLIV